MEYYELHPKNPQSRYINRAVEILREGGIIIYPTDTVYGIGCDIFNKAALDRVRTIKNDPDIKLLSFICPSLKNISSYAKVSDYAYRNMKYLLPGPYTFILEGSKLVPKIMLTKRKTAGIRVPDHKICLELVGGLGNPIITTSATMPDGSILNDASLIHDIFKNRIDMVIDGDIVSGKPSSVISLIDDTPEIIRKGLGDVSLFE